MLGKREEIICFKDASEMTIGNVLYIVRFHRSIYNDELYLVDEHGKEHCTNVQHGRMYICKRRQYKHYK